MSERPLLCLRCGHRIEEHSVAANAIPADVLPRLTEARFLDLDVHGFYCPHLDMRAGEDYDDG